MKTKLIAVLLVAGGSLLAETHFSIGVHVGIPPVYGYVPVAPPRVVVAYHPPCPGPGYIWIDGYHDGYGRWFNGYWALPPYAGAYWVAPRFSGRHFYPGQWAGARYLDRGDSRFRYSRVQEWRGREIRDGRGNSERGRNRGFDRDRDYRRGSRH